MPEKQVFNLVSCGCYRSIYTDQAWCGSACCAGYAGGYPSNSIMFDAVNRDCFYSHDAAGYVGCPDGTGMNTTNHLTPTDSQSVYNDIGIFLYNVLGPVQPYRCNNGYLQAGMFNQGNVPVYYGCNTALIAGIGGLTAHDQTTYHFWPGGYFGSGGAASQPVGTSCAHSLDDSCKNLYGAADVCYDATGAVVPCSPTPAGDYWLVTAPHWDQSLGTCVQDIRHMLGTGIVQTWTPHFAGCPAGTSEYTIDPRELGGLATDTFTPISWQMHPGETNQSGQTLLNIGNRFSTYSSGQTWYALPTAWGFAAGNPTNPPVGTVGGHPGCFAPWSGNSCPANSTDNGLYPKGCPGVVLGPLCAAPGYYTADAPGAVGLTRPFCRTDAPIWINGMYTPIARSPVGRIYMGSVTRYDDSRPEVFADAQTVGGVVSSRSNGYLDSFYFEQGVSGGNRYERLKWLRSEDGGDNWGPLAPDQSNPPAGAKQIWHQDAAGNLSTYYWAVPVQLYETTPGGRFIGIYQTVWHNESGCAVLAYFVKDTDTSEFGQWYARVLKPGATKDTWTVGPDGPLTALRGQNTAASFFLTKSGDLEFLFYDENGVFRATRCRDVQPDNPLVWEWLTGTATESLFDGTATEQHLATAFHSWAEGLAFVIYWIPNQLGEVYSGDWTHKGKLWARPFTLDSGFHWTPGTAYQIDPDDVDSNTAGYSLKLERDKTWVLRRSGYPNPSPVYRLRAWDGAGFGSWDKD